MYFAYFDEQIDRSSSEFIGNRSSSVFNNKISQIKYTSFVGIMFYQPSTQRAITSSARMFSICSTEYVASCSLFIGDQIITLHGYSDDNDTFLETWFGFLLYVVQYILLELLFMVFCNYSFVKKIKKLMWVLSPKFIHNKRFHHVGIDITLKGSIVKEEIRLSTLYLHWCRWFYKYSTPLSVSNFVSLYKKVLS